MLSAAISGVCLGNPPVNGLNTVPYQNRPVVGILGRVGERRALR